MTFKIFSDDQIRNKDIDTLKRFLRIKLGGYRVAINDMSTDNLLYRGVMCPELPCTIDRISYPPPDKVVNLGRANRVGQPMFYASRAAPAVFFESRAKQGELFAMSEWEVAEPLWMHNLGYHKDALLKLGAPGIEMRARLTDPIQNESRENATLRKQLSLAFTEDIQQGREYRYKQSIAINELLFGDAEPLPIRPNGPTSSRVAGTVYPAMQMRGAADNMAIWPEFVDSSLRIKSVRYVLVEAADAAGSAYTVLTVAYSNTFAGRDIVWQDNLPPENQRRSRISLENGDWVLRDGYDRVYDRH